jgi:hypothetical protein
MLVDPVTDEDIGFTGSGSISVGTKDEFFTIAREHGKPIEAFVVGNPLKTGSIDVDDVEVKVSRSWIGKVGTENDPLSIRVKEGGKVCSTVTGYLPNIRPIGIHDVNLQCTRANQVLLEEFNVFDRIRTSWPRRTKDNLAAVETVECTPVISERIGQTAEIRAIQIARVQLNISVAG